MLCSNVYIKFIKIILLLFLANFAYSQQCISTAGGSNSGENGSFSFTVGQIDYSNNSNSSGSLSEGVQQPFELFSMLDIPTHCIADYTVSVYPNPASNFIAINIESSATFDAQYFIYDTYGKLVDSDFLSSGVSFVKLDYLKSGLYNMFIFDSSHFINSFKIIKF